MFTNGESTRGGRGIGRFLTFTDQGVFSDYWTITGIIHTRLAPLLPGARSQEPHSSTGQTLVSPGPSPGQLVPSPSRDRTPTRDRQWSVPGHLVPPSIGGPALKWSQAVSQLSSQRSDPPVTIGLTARPTNNQGMSDEPPLFLHSLPHEP